MIDAKVCCIRRAHCFSPAITLAFFQQNSVDGTGGKTNHKGNADELDLGAHLLTNLSDAFSGANNIFSKILSEVICLNMTMFTSAQLLGKYQGSLVYLVD